MIDKKNNCSFKEHKEDNSIIFCNECKIYMCNDCKKEHKRLFENHNILDLDCNIKGIFNGSCKVKNHFQKLEYFCKNHNQLCCAACIAKIKNDLNGQHTDCNVCIIQDIKQEKKNKLKENLKYLENLFVNLDESINEIKILFEKLKKNKEYLKQKIQNIFNRIRNILNERENYLLSEIDKHFTNLFFDDKLIKESENLANKIKDSLEKGRIIDNEWEDNNKLSPLINDCIIIENNIKYSNLIYNSLQKCKSNKNIKINFIYEDINNILERINNFGIVYYNNFKFRQCPKDIDENRKYIVSGDNGNILIKSGPNNYAGTICEYELEKNKNHKWKIKILKAQLNQILVGIAPIDFDINSSNHHTCGWYLNCYNSTLYSGPPHNYNGNRTNLSKVKDEIIIIMNMKEKSLKFIVNNEDKGYQYKNIPLDKPIFPAVLLYNRNSSVGIFEC